ncbi:MAG: tyrosine-type recombinase/integrase [Oscillibacter sp.]|nr:tyrosine-type recombinase/integrase [Oscillibacter sp.]
MASTRQLTTKDGRVFYEITVSRGRSKARLTKRWYPPDGWSRKVIERELASVAAEFERQSDAGEVVSRAEKRAQEAQEAEENAKILTVRQYGEQVFMPAKTVVLSEYSRDHYQRMLDKRVYPAIGDVKLPDVTPVQISAILLKMQSEGLAHNTVVRMYALLHVIFKTAYQDEMLEKNPMDRVRRPKPRKDEIRDETADACTVAEIRQILKCSEQEPLMYQVILRVLIDTGIRRGECCAIKWESIDFEEGIILIGENVGYTPKKGVYLDTPKTSRKRLVYIGKETLRLLKQYRAEQDAKGGCEWVFSNTKGDGPVNPNNISDYVHDFSLKYGIPGLHPHKLRHSFASVAITNGADIASVAEALGHADKSLTLRMYTHSNQESISRAAKTFRNAIENAVENAEQG